MVIVLTGIVCADQAVPAVPETQGLVTTTIADVVGMTTETDAGTWSLTNGITINRYWNDVGWFWIIPPAGWIEQVEAAGGSVEYTLVTPTLIQWTALNIPVSILDQQIPGAPAGWTNRYLGDYLLGYEGNPDFLDINGPSLDTGTLNPKQVRYTTTYDANIVAQAGHTVLTKSMNINTGNKVLTQSNLKAETGLTYIATSDGGNVVGSENLMIDGAGNTTSASDRIICPFASQPVDVIPAYCNIVQTGNSYDLTVGSVASTMSERFVSSDVINPVQLDQVFTIKPYGTNSGTTLPAYGTTSAYIRAHIQEARDYNNSTINIGSGAPVYVTVPSTPLKAEDLQYSETSSASGVIQQFTKVINYQSGKSLL